MRQLKISKSITNRESASLDKYLNEISKIVLLTADEETALTQRVKMGEAKALQTLITSNLRFVVSVAKQYQYRGLSLVDLINEGNIGLITAAKRFDESKGFKFISYAIWWIRQSIIQAINDTSRMVRLPSNRVDLYNRILVGTNTLEQLLEREPSAEEIANHLLVSVTDVMRSKENRFHLSLDLPVNDEVSGITLADQLVSDKIKDPDNDVQYTDSLSVEVSRCMKTLPELQQKILRAYFGLGDSTAISLAAIASEHNLSTERIRQLKDKALRKLSIGKTNSLLKPFLAHAW